MNDIDIVKFTCIGEHYNSMQNATKLQPAVFHPGASNYNMLFGHICVDDAVQNLIRIRHGPSQGGDVFQWLGFHVLYGTAENAKRNASEGYCLAYELDCWPPSMMAKPKSSQPTEPRHVILGRVDVTRPRLDEIRASLSDIVSTYHLSELFDMARPITGGYKKDPENPRGPSIMVPPATKMIWINGTNVYDGSEKHKQAKGAVSCEVLDIDLPAVLYKRLCEIGSSMQKSAQKKKSNGLGKNHNNERPRGKHR